MPLLALALATFGSGNLARADTVIYDVTVDTTSLSTTQGYLDFQFNPMDPSSPAATATVTSFVTDGTAGHL